MTRPPVPDHHERRQRDSRAPARLYGCFALLFTSAVLVGCQEVETTSEGAVGVERTQSMFTLISTEEMNRMAAEGYRAAVEQADRAGKLNRDEAMVRRVRAIAERIIPSVSSFRPDAVGWAWEVNVEQNEALNAYCSPGGKIMFFSGIIERLELTDDEIAAIMGHEIAHALREHGREQMSKVYAQQVGASVISLVTGGEYDRYISLGMDGFNLFVNLPNSRHAETEADAIGVELAARAGYDPAAAITLWQKMAKANDGAPPQFLSTHPSSETRMVELQALQPKVQPLYEAARAAAPPAHPLCRALGIRTHDDGAGDEVVHAAAIVAKDEQAVHQRQHGADDRQSADQAVGHDTVRDQSREGQELPIVSARDSDAQKQLADRLPAGRKEVAVGDEVSRGDRNDIDKLLDRRELAGQQVVPEVADTGEGCQQREWRHGVDQRRPEARAARRKTVRLCGRPRADVCPRCFVGVVFAHADPPAPRAPGARGG